MFQSKSSQNNAKKLLASIKEANATMHPHGLTRFGNRNLCDPMTFLYNIEEPSMSVEIVVNIFEYPASYFYVPFYNGWMYFPEISNLSQSVFGIYSEEISEEIGDGYWEEKTVYYLLDDFGFLQECPGEDMPLNYSVSWQNFGKGVYDLMGEV